MLKSAWWQIRQRIAPYRGIVANWEGFRFLLFLDDRPFCLGQWMIDFASLVDVKILSELILQPGDTVFDVGANYGYTATLLAKAVGKSGKVLAVEAAPHTAARMRKQISLAQLEANVIIAPTAVGDEIKIVPMRVSFEARQDCQFVPSPAALTDSLIHHFPDEILVPMSTLDHLSSEYNLLEPSLIKLDIEGYEYYALRGAQELLNSANPPWLIIEVLRNCPEPQNQLLQQIVSYSRDLLLFDDYHQLKGADLESISAILEKKSYINLIVMPPKGHFRSRFTHQPTPS